MPERFDRIALGNGGLPTGATPLPRAFHLWRAFARWSPVFPIGRIVNAGCVGKLSDAEIAAYDAPFPESRYKMAARLFPGFVPASPDDPERAANERAWEVFKHWEKPFLTCFSSGDPITRGGERIWLKLVPGTKGQPHTTIRRAGHFLQEDKGPELAEVLSNFIRGTPRKDG
jgi:haloalkane dehalogenase